MEKMKKNSGQALLIILLVMAVGLTVALAVVSRSVTDVGVSRQEEESARVFSVAEAGIEEALRSGAVPPGGVVEIGGIRATVTRSNLGNASDFVFPGEYSAGDIQTLWLVEHGQDGSLDLNNPPSPYTGNSLDIYWGKPGNTTIPALEVTLFYNQGGIKIKRWALDPDTGRNNGFDTAISSGTQLGGKDFRYKKSLSLPCSQTGVICYALRLRLLYNNEEEILGAKAPSGTIPSQGVCFESTASPQGGGVTRRVRQCQLYKSPPGIFDYVLYSDQDLIKN